MASQRRWRHNRIGNSTIIGKICLTRTGQAEADERERRSLRRVPGVEMLDGPERIRAACYGRRGRSDAIDSDALRATAITRYIGLGHVGDATGHIPDVEARAWAAHRLRHSTQHIRLEYGADSRSGGLCEYDNRLIGAAYLRPVRDSSGVNGLQLRGCQ